ncbi:MAG: hypothetical protein LBI89_04235 [Prevotellaceae bacterium]|jgi:hypothetical protein|nr:hypothetical protein [Prevotellaceae bacterium]
MKRYPVRALKSIVYFFIIAFLLLALIYFLSVHRTLGFAEFLQRNDLTMMAVFLGFFGLVYPAIGYVTQKTPRSRPFTDSDREAVVNIFTNARFTLTGDDGSVLTFRINNPVARVTRLFEDAITVNYAANPLEIEGLRRDVVRLSRAIERHLRQTDEEHNG